MIWIIAFVVTTVALLFGGVVGFIIGAYAYGLHIMSQQQAQASDVPRETEQSDVLIQCSWVDCEATMEVPAAAQDALMICVDHQGYLVEPGFLEMN